MVSDLLANRKISLFVGFGAMFSIASLLTMAALMWGLGSIEDDLDGILGDHRKKMRMVVEMRNAARARTMRLSNMILFEDPFVKDDEYLRFNKFGASFVRSRLKLLEHDLTQEEKNILEAQGKMTAPAVEVQREIVDLVYADDMEKAHNLLTNEAIPLQNQVMDQLTKLYNYQEKSLDAAIRQSEKNYRTIRSWILVFATTAGVIGIFVALFIGRRNHQVSSDREKYLKQIEDANIQLEIARQQAEDANTTKTQFLANMSHELRTPLNAIMGYSELLQEEFKENNLLAEYQEDCERIHNSGAHLLNLINEVLDLSKIEAGKMTVSNEKFDVRALVDSVVNIIKPIAENNGNKLEVNYHLGVKNMVSDDTKLKQVLMNILSNASKFTHDGVISLEVASNVDDGIRWFTFKVEDSGIGIAPEKLDQIFDPFEQVDDSNTRHYEGTGLGLSITKSFCEMLSGSVSLFSELGKGTTCIVRLPDQPQALDVSSDPNSDYNSDLNKDNTGRSRMAS